MLSGIGKDAGATAAETLKDTVGQATAAIGQDIPAAASAVKDIEDHGVYGLSGLIADITNRLNGAELPVDLTITVRITGKVGALKLTIPS